MRKQTKLVAVASAAALLAIGASMTSFAAAGWVEEDGQWFYYDKDGNRVEDEWKKSGDNWYWLDSDEGGAMAVDKLVEDGDNTYYVDSNGVMVRNQWIQVVNEDQNDDDDPAEYNFYYMQSNGKAYKNTSNKLSKKVINGKRYAFDDSGKMLYGWVTEDGDMQNDEDGWKEADYYFGNWDDGSMKTDWQLLTVHDDEGDKDDDYDYYFCFKSNGKKRKETDKNKNYKWNGKYYHFDERGVMVYEWYETDALSSSSGAASAGNWNYFRDPLDGARVVKGWFKVAPPTEDNSFLESDATFAASDSADETDRWYYSDGSDDGLVEGEIKKIKGKYYGFWPDDDVDSTGASVGKGGRMLTGLCALQMDPSDGSKIVHVIDDNMDSDDLDDFMDTYKKAGQKDNNVYLYYFGNDGDQDVDGAMKTGNVTINLDGDNYQFYFKKTGGAESRGRGVTGIDDGKYIYQYGQKLKASTDNKYMLVWASGDVNTKDEGVAFEVESSDVRANLTADYSGGDSDFVAWEAGTDIGHDDKGQVNVRYGFDVIGTSKGAYYLVNTSGRIQTGSKSGIKDGDDWYWWLDHDWVVMYTDSKDISNNNTDAVKKGNKPSLKEMWNEDVGKKTDGSSSAAAKIEGVQGFSQG